MLQTPQWKQSPPHSLCLCGLRKKKKVIIERKHQLVQGQSHRVRAEFSFTEQKSHRAVIQLDVATAVAPRTPVYHEVQVCWETFAIPRSCDMHVPPPPSPDSRRPCQTNKFPFSASEQFTKRRATSAINYISAIKVPTSDLA